MRITYIVDTGPLYDYLAASYDDMEKTGQWSKQTVICDSMSMHRFRGFLERVGPVATVSGVMMEVGWLFQRDRGKAATYGPLGFWRRSWPLLNGDDRKIRDFGSAVGRLGIDVVDSFGPVDASLVALAKRIRGLRGQDARIVTSDSPFHSRFGHEVPIIHVQEILHGQWQPRY